MHNGMLRLAGEKMSKSLGNIVSLREALDEWGAETILFYFMTGHWRKPIDFSVEALDEAEQRVKSLKNSFRDESWQLLSGVLDRRVRPDASFVRDIRIGAFIEELLIAATQLTWHPPRRRGDPVAPPKSASVGPWTTDVLFDAWQEWNAQLPPRQVHAEEAGRFDWNWLITALDNDFNTPDALVVVRRLQRSRKLGLLFAALDTFGLATLAQPAVTEVHAFDSGRGSEQAMVVKIEGSPPSIVRHLVDRRHSARIAGDFAESDRLRKLIEAEGWTVRDEPFGYLVTPLP
jgi:cysteinyl-tRNA synthetase